MPFNFPAQVHVAPPAIPTFTATPPNPATAHVVPVAGREGPPGPPGDSVVQYEHTQSTPASLWGPIVHNLGRRPTAVSLFSTDFSQQYGQFNVQHLDENSLRISMDTPTAGKALIG